MMDREEYVEKLETIKKLPLKHRSGARLLLIDELEGS